MYSVNLYKIMEFNDEKPVVLITLYYLRSIYLYSGNSPFLTLTLLQYCCVSTEDNYHLMQYCSGIREDNY